ncbi:hypothetical protein QNA08_08870 [Chelatococcus sp. SYSU_G07232]|uniref:Signaling protein n=1 Tax=Chelatococcus albus TaxID=3047466 RepID=A0ABT7AG39_9HYPH|nr:hypothetical protein [Chelatococcus sp. SYSU_G07232]MDJ1158343.1 hypothetical protein [Chelatococcus sp. SYSU_G07232]
MAETAHTRFNLRNFITLVCVTILVGTEVFGVAFAAGWALAGLFELGTTVEYIFMAAFGLVGLWLMKSFVHKALQVEPINERV